jgi:hypothetical protein
MMGFVPDLAQLNRGGLLSRMDARREVKEEKVEQTRWLLLPWSRYVV